MTRTFPKQIYVRWNDDGDGFLDASETAIDAEDGERVAIYERQQIVRKVVTHELLPMKRKA